jgi:hypothetical protein
MAAPAKAYRKINSIDHAAPIGLALANVIVAWSQAENSLLTLCQELLGVSYSDAAVVFFSIPSFDGRTKLVKNLIKTGSIAAGKDLADVLIAVEGLRGLSRTRNSYVHNSWAESLDKKQVVIFDYIEPAGKDRRKEVKSNDLNIHAQAVRARSEALWEELEKAFPPKRGKPPALVPKKGHP